MLKPSGSLPVFLLVLVGLLFAGSSAVLAADEPLAVFGPASGSLPFEDGFEPRRVTRLAGGSNYLWYFDDGQCSVQSRDPYGLLKRYHQTDAALGPVRRIVRRQLRTMHKQGMRRLSLGFHFMHRPAPGGTLVDSSDADEILQLKQNLALLLADVREQQYEEVLFRFFPVNNMSPSDPAFPSEGSAEFDARLDEYWNLIETLRPVLVDAGIDYRIDLMVEGAPRDSNPTWVRDRDRYKYPANTRWSRAVRALWQRYFATHGSEDTVGFSFIVDEDNNRLRSRVRHMRYIYEDHYPPVFAIDFYAGLNWDEYEKFSWMDGYMVDQNPDGAHWDVAPWIITEAYYEDPFAAEGLAQAITDSGREVLYLTQWPLDREANCREIGVNVRPPLRWKIWPAHGF